MPAAAATSGSALSLVGQVGAETAEPGEVVGLHHVVTDELLAEDLADLGLQRRRQQARQP